MKSVIFVCLGNICRSPLAEGVAKEYIKQNNIDLVVDSAGTGSWHVGEAPCTNSLEVAFKYGIDISSLKARQVNVKDFEKFDLIVALDENNKLDLELMGAKNLVKLGNFGYDGKDVPDPYFFEGYDGFEEVFRMIDACVKNMIQKEFE